jgi:radical SAM protein with 4Fe4S-binding SPASM domain
MIRKRSHRRSRVSPWVPLKLFSRVAPHPWIVFRLAGLELDKGLFNLLHARDSGLGGKIRQVSLRITDLCNLRCHTCGQWGDHGFLHGKSPKVLRRQEVTPARYLELFSDLVGTGHRPMVYLWGGEPMLYEGILEVMGGAAGLKLPVSIATNGTRLAASAPSLVGMPLFLLQVSIDGPSADLHNRLRPSAGGGNSFGEIEDGLEAVNLERRRRGSSLPVIASLTVISRENVSHLVDIYEAFRNRVDLFVFYLSWWISADRSLEHEEDFHRRFGFRPVKHRGWIGSWTPEDYGLLHRQLRTLSGLSRRASAPPVTVLPRILGEDNLRAYYTDHKARFGFDQCISIFQGVEVNSNGDVSPCRDYHDYVVGNVKETTLSRLWNAEPYRRFRISLAREGLMPACSRCCGLMGY